jgi:hypothetical protein
MLVRTFPNIRRYLTAIGTTDVFEPMTDWAHTIEAASAIQGVLMVRQISGTFRVRLGIQTATSTLNQQGPVTSLAAYPLYYNTAGTGTFFRFDPNGASDGNIDAGAYFRLGLLYNFTGTAGQGDIELQGLAWR